MELQIHFYLHISGLTITWDVFEFPSNTLYRIMRCSLTITWDVFELLHEDTDDYGATV